MSTYPSSANPAALMHEISAALRRGDVAAAERMLEAGQPTPAALSGGADMAIRARRWGDAVWMLEHIANRDTSSEIKRCLCRNLASLQIHRPEIYELLVALPKTDKCSIGASATGHPTIVCRRADGQNIALSPGNQPLQGLAATMAQLKPALDAGHALGLCGMGDGYLLHQLAQKPPKLFMDTQQSVFVLEPDAHVALTAMMIHDYTGPGGPIEQKRFHWFVGKDWGTRLRAVLAADLFLPAPHISLMLGLNPAEIQAVLTTIIRDLGARDKNAGTALREYYDSLSPAELGAVFGENPPRRPRVLLLTTRFSTVLQYATRDAAVGFQQAGCETRLLIEPTTHHRMLTIAIRSTLAEFKPDLVFQIDHQRQEHANLYPPNLPFACWIQDHMTHLMSPQVGAQVGPTDFVLTDAGPLYVHNFGYPQRQMIALAKLTAAPPLLPRPSERAEDVIFISHASGTPQAIHELILKRFAGSNIAPAFLTECVRRMIDMYAAGDSLSTYRDICEFVQGMLTEFDQRLEGSQFLDITAMLTHPIGDSLYRQQALRWAAGACKSLGLSFALYGNGWNAHPEFAEYARGPVAPGRAFLELTRRAAINLQIAPYFCLHQRLLDGICSGAFFLVRNHISDVAPQAMLDLLESSCGSDVERLDQARSRIPPPMRDRFENLLKDCKRSLCSTGTEDPIEIVRAWQEARMLVPSEGVLPRLDAISFSDATSLRGRIEQYVNNPELREQIATEQRQSIEGRLTYNASMANILRRIGQLMAGQMPQTFASSPINIDFGRAA